MACSNPTPQYYPYSTNVPTFSPFYSSTIPPTYPNTYTTHPAPQPPPNPNTISQPFPSYPSSTPSPQPQPPLNFPSYPWHLHHPSPHPNTISQTFPSYPDQNYSNHYQNTNLSPPTITHNPTHHTLQQQNYSYHRQPLNNTTHHTSFPSHQIQTSQPTFVSSQTDPPSLQQQVHQAADSQPVVILNPEFVQNFMTKISELFDKLRTEREESYLAFKENLKASQRICDEQLQKKRQQKVDEKVTVVVVERVEKEPLEEEEKFTGENEEDSLNPVEEQKEIEGFVVHSTKTSTEILTSSRNSSSVNKLFPTSLEFGNKKHAQLQLSASSPPPSRPTPPPKPPDLLTARSPPSIPRPPPKPPEKFIFLSPRLAPAPPPFREPPDKLSASFTTPAVRPPFKPPDPKSSPEILLLPTPVPRPPSKPPDVHSSPEIFQFPLAVRRLQRAVVNFKAVGNLEQTLSPPPPDLKSSPVKILAPPLPPPPPEPPNLKKDVNCKFIVKMSLHVTLPDFPLILSEVF